MFIEDKEIISYKSLEECLEKATWLLDNPKRCIDIGKNAQKRVLQDHTIYHRSEIIIKAIQDYLSVKGKKHVQFRHSN